MNGGFRDFLNNAYCSYCSDIGLVHKFIYMLHMKLLLLVTEIYGIETVTVTEIHGIEAVTVITL